MASASSTKTESQVTQQELPAWAQEYYGSILGRGLSMIDQPYQKYTGDRVAGFTPEQQQAFDLVQKGIGNWQPYVNQAQQMATQAGGASALGAANPYLTSGVSREAMTAASPYLQRAGIGSALSSANPYLRAGSGSFTQNVDQYMNPYNTAVTNRIGEMAARNLRENLLPAVNRTFIGGGTFGGSRSADFTARAVRDAQEAALAEQNKALQAGYGQAADIYNTEAQRNLTAGQAAGQLSEADLTRMLNTGKSYADIANQIATNNLQAGQVAGNLSSSDYDRMLRASGQISGLGTQYQTQYGTDVSALSQAGGARQQLGQKVADVNYQNFLDQQNAPMKRLQDLAALGQATPTPMTSYTNTSSTATGPAPSSLGTLAGLGTSIIGGIGGTGGFGQGGWFNNIINGGSGTTGGTANPPAGNTMTNSGAVNIKKGGPVKGNKSKRGLGWLKDMK